MKISLEIFNNRPGKDRIHMSNIGKKFDNSPGTGRTF